jgi:spermidine synthase
MSRTFEVLDWQDTRLGTISLRRRVDPTLGRELYEAKLNDEYLMSSLFTVAEIELARLGLAAVDGDDLDVLVGGLGLGYTAVAALEDERVRRLTVVEALGPVVDWHRRELLPDAAGLAADPRTTLLEADFFALMRGEDPAAGTPVRDLDAILLDVDHTPRHVLHPSHRHLYTDAGLRELAGHLRPDGVFALWSDDPEDPDFMETARGVFGSVEAHEVGFDNPLTGGRSANTVYVARGHATKR